MKEAAFLTLFAIAAIVIKKVNIWLGVCFTFCGIFGFACYNVYDVYRYHKKISKDDVNEISWYLIKWFVYALIGVVLIAFTGEGEGFYRYDELERLEPG